MDTEELQGAAVAFAFASHLIYEGPEAGQLAQWAADRVFDEAPFGVDNSQVQEGLALMAAYGRGAYDQAQLRRDWFQLLVGAGVPTAPSWAGYHMSANAQILSEATLPVRRLYESYGFEMERKNREPDDNLGVMLGFLAYLMGQEARCSNEEEARRLSQDQRTLLEKHVLPWIAVWRYDVEKNARTDFMRGLGLFVFGLCEAYGARFGWRFDWERQRFENPCVTAGPLA